jgi:2-alkyl-3-oxoalkanoate reductase
LTEATAGTVAITGATGFIGHAIARHLAKHGWRLRLLARPGSESRLPPLESAQTLVGSLTEADALRRLLQGADALVNCAGAVRGARRTDFDRVNVAGVTALLDAAAGLQSLRVVHMSSLAAREPQLSDYAASKQAGEALLIERLPASQRVVLRPPAVYGPRDRELRPLLERMADGLALVPGPRHARFSLLYVDDLAAAVGCLLAQPVGWGQTHEPDDGHPSGYSWPGLIAAVRHVAQRPVRTLHVPDLVLKAVGACNEWTAQLIGGAPMLNRGKARELLWPNWVARGNASLAGSGWLPQFDLDRGLRSTFCGDVADA